ncbi:kinesin-like protein CG14535 isoform X2 [Homalodisca vitripennis]|uniref:kinesin-like protein CG14535 isoform X2 n=1 Tax=Homalodisca vitripennis TaxID=197043 RepID=UPI001EEA3B55|nr:kinesin-like protein CG14535 isoform X2 [Homalodisca vitripennis]
MAEVESPGGHRGVAGVGKIKRRGTPIPVLPPRVPSPMPPPNTRVSHSSEGPPAPLSSSQRKALAAQMAERLLQEEADPMKSWINPRIFSKINHEAVTAADFNPHRVYRPPPEPERYRSPQRSRPAVSSSSLAAEETARGKRDRDRDRERERDRAMDVDSGNESALSSRRGKFRYGVVLEGGDTTKWLGKHQIITSSKPVVGEVFIDGPLSELPPSAKSAVVQELSEVRRRRSSSQPPQGYQGVQNYQGSHGYQGGDGTRGSTPNVRMESQFSYSVAGTMGTTAQASAAAAFFARAAQKLNLSSSPSRRKRSDDESSSSSGFCGAIHRSPPAPPPALLRRIGVKEVTGVGKVKVMLRVAGDGSSTTDDSSSFLSVDKRRKQITLFDPALCGVAAPGPEDRRVGVAAPKMFAFDSIFTHEDSQAEVCSSALTDIIHAVINGSDGCLFCFGHAKLGKTQTMLGTPESASTLGIIPSSIAWLFRGISEQKQKTGARFSVRVSAVEVSQNLKDLLAGHANECEQSPGVYLRDDPLQLQNYSELRVPTADKAAFYLDAALNSRGPQTHFLYTLHVYQYSVATKGAVAGGRSRLHLIDLGSCERSKLTGGLSLSGLGNVLLAIFNGQKHLPHREHKLTQVLKECLSSLTCHVAMITHVSPEAQHYSDTLGTVQLASRVHRIRRRRFKFTGGNAGVVAGEDVNRGTTSSEVDPSSSEQSADTVIYVGPSDETDGEHPPVYLPSLNSGDNRCAMGKALRGSGMEPKVERGVRSNISKSVPASPQRMAQEVVQMNGTHEDRSSPLRSGKVGGKSGLVSSKSSPSRTINRSKESSKPPRLNGTHTPEERWIDGPRIPKSKVAEARNLHMMNKDGQHLLAKKEMWVDGPLNVENGLGYGFMDYHKKNMIRKWVENQTVQIQKHKNAPREKTPPRRYVANFKTCSDSSDGACGVRGQASGQEDEEDHEEVMAPLPQTSVVARNGEMSRVVPIERLQGTNEEEEEDEQIEVEIIELEEPAELVAMQDSCLQVTEEDIALCMGEVENPLPEVDQEEHPLRILSQENLTVVSTFTDSLSIANDLERLFPRGPGYFHHTAWLKTQTLDHRKKDLDCRLDRSYQRKPTDSCPSRQVESRPFSRCQSLSLSDMLAQGEQQNGGDFDTSSIVSEPAYCLGDDKKNGKFCLNCKGSLTNGGLYDTSHFSHLTRSISSLRHPDGASNPNLQEEVKERAPVTGGECLTRRGEEEDDEPRVPPPLQSSLLTLSREGFVCSKMKNGDSSGYVSCTQPDSQSQSSIHDPGGQGLQYCQTDLERLERGWNESHRLRELRREQRILKAELASAKSRLLIPADRWSYERDSRGGQLAELGRPAQFPGSSAPRNGHSAQES